MNSTDTTTAALTTGIAELPRHAGASLGPTRWRTLTQEQVNAFAELTEDHNPIHVDPERAAATPFGGTIVHGYFTVSLLAPMLDELLQVQGASMSVNYGMDKLRLPAPVPVGARFRTTADVLEATEIEGGVQVKLAATVEVESSDKPAVVAECLFRHYS
jgi:acyl dehydratase